MGTQKQEFVDKEAVEDRRFVEAAGASLGEQVDWHSINWKQAHRNVRLLQACIVKAFRSRVLGQGR
jgi:hypothetical protein